jgi:two-component system, cell cycle response regulator
MSGTGVMPAQYCGNTVTLSVYSISGDETPMTAHALQLQSSQDHPLPDALPRSLLVVDDDGLSLTLMAERLTAAGYQVTTAQDGAQACRLIQKQQFPIVITDYRMPTMDGAQFIERVREQVGDRSYCIMWTMCAEDEDRIRSFKCGVDDHVSKRVSDLELLARVEAGFKTMELRQSLRRTRRFMAQGDSPQRQRDSLATVEGWNTAASHLHAEMARALRNRLPLCILMLHVERLLIPHDVTVRTRKRIVDRESSLLASLTSALHSKIRAGVDMVLPLEVESGTARVLIVLPDTVAAETARVRERIATAISESLMTDEDAEMRPDCTIGLASFDGASQDALFIANAAELVAAAEMKMERLALPLG